MEKLSNRSSKAIFLFFFSFQTKKKWKEVNFVLIIDAIEIADNSLKYD